MSVQLSLRKALTSAALAAFTGAQGEAVADVTNNRLVLNDGVTAGGWPAAKLAEVLLNTTQDNIAAHAGGGQASATALSKTISRVTIVASANDSCALAPSSTTNVFQVVINDGVNALQLFGTNSDTINGETSGTGISLAAGKIGIFFSPSPGIWRGGTLN